MPNLSAFELTLLVLLVAFVLMFLPEYLRSIKNQSPRKSPEEERNDLEERLKSVWGFSATEFLEWGVMGPIMGVDKESKKLAFFSYASHSTFPSKIQVLEHRDILSVELYEDGNSITKTNRLSQAGHALLGGLLVGGAGVLLGGLTGKTKTSQTVTSIVIRLVINDIDNPVLDVTLLDREINKASNRYKRIMNLARKWTGIAEVLIKIADTEDKETSQEKHEHEEPKQNPAKSHTHTYTSVADEVKKLASLESEGIITSEEFQQAKTKLLQSMLPEDNK